MINAHIDNRHDDFMKLVKERQIDGIREQIIGGFGEINERRNDQECVCRSLTSRVEGYENEYSLKMDREQKVIKMVMSAKDNCESDDKDDNLDDCRYLMEIVKVHVEHRHNECWEYIFL